MVVRSFLLAENHLVSAGEKNKQGTAGAGAYELWSIDIAVDDEMNPWLLEMNRTPQMWTKGCSVQKGIKTLLLAETLTVAGFHLPSSLPLDLKVCSWIFYGQESEVL